jgi:hypothetical protein
VEAAFLLSHLGNMASNVMKEKCLLMSFCLVEGFCKPEENPVGEDTSFAYEAMSLAYREN